MNILLMGLLLSASHTVFAHDGEDHGAPPPAVTQAVATRASAGSDEFEMVMIKEDQKLVLYLDHTATNEPVVGATVDVDGGGMTGRAIESAPGVYVIDTPTSISTLAPAKHALTISIETGESADLLSATLDVSPPNVDVEQARGGRGRLIWLVVGALTLIAAIGWVLRRRQPSKGVQ